MIVVSIDSIEQELNHAFDVLLSEHSDASRWVVSLSGGLDSSVLLHALLRWKSESKLSVHTTDTSYQNESSIPPISALHINHQLSEESIAWADECVARCAEYDIDCVVEVVDVASESGLGLEGAARTARYAAYERVLSNSDVLLQGHHANDQFETVLLRLMRGAGLQGLAAIPMERSLTPNRDIRVYRPLLRLSQAQLHTYARYHVVTWQDDPSNQDMQFDRNYLRHGLIPLFEARWPEVLDNVSNSVAWLAESTVLSHEVAHDDLRRLDVRHDRWGDDSVCLDALRALSVPRQKNALRVWSQHTFGVALNRHQLNQLVDENFSKLLLSKSQMVNDTEQMIYECYARRMYVHRSNVSASFDEQQTVEIARAERVFIDQVGELCIDYDPIHFKEWASDKGTYSLTVQFRQGGERAHPATRTHSQTLKKLFQEYQVPPWWRSKVPLMYYGSTLLLVGDVWVEHGVAEIFEIQCSWRRPCNKA
ncbi:MAG: tRNA lysidine(34) synthetase TilS [Pseudomonadota bacterium]